MTGRQPGAADPTTVRWRQGTKVPHHVYRQRGPQPDTRPWPDGDQPIAMFLDPGDAELAVRAVNAPVSSVPDTAPDDKPPPRWLVKHGTDSILGSFATRAEADEAWDVVHTAYPGAYVVQDPARPASPAQPPADAPTTTETRTEYRLCGVHPHYGHEIADEYDGDDGLRLARDQAQHCIEDGWAEMQIESRTVTTTRTETAWTEAQ